MNAFRRRVWTAGKLLGLAGALVATFFIFGAASMRIALRAREVAVPDLTNRTASEATAIVNGLGLSLRVDESRRMDARIGADRVLTQEPAPGTTTRRPRSLKVWLSAGPRATKVPSLAGETERAATLRLAQDGLALAGVAEIRSPSYPLDVVVAQDPAANTGAARVALLVNRAETGDTYVMPDLTGVSSDRAAIVLRGHGFRVAIVGAVPSPTTPPGIVLGQRPKAGFQIAPGEPISLEVSK